MHHCDSWRIKDKLYVTCYFISLLMCSTCFGHWYIHHQELATILSNYHIGRIVLGSVCAGISVWLGWSGIRVAGWSTTCASACNTDTTPTQPHQTENNTTNVVIRQNSRKLLMMDISMSKTCWAHKWNKMAVTSSWSSKPATRIPLQPNHTKTPTHIEPRTIRPMW